MDAMGERRLRVLAPTRYGWRFNSPRHSRHSIENRGFLPLNYISSAMEGVTVLNPFPPARFDLVHAFNRIPVSLTPYVIGFESHLPRGFGLEDTAFYRAMTRSLLSPRCRRIIAISRWARGTFEHFHQDKPYWDDLSQKLEVRYPNMPVPDIRDEVDADDPTLRVMFVGNHFGRKGGCVAVRLAEKALAEGFPLEVTVVSTLRTGSGVWTDPLRPEFFDRYTSLLALPNVTHYPGLPNDEILALLRRSHLSLLPTFSDTFGYSAIESMMVHVPVIATPLHALGEFVIDGDTGCHVHLACKPKGDWIHIDHPDRSSPEFERLFEEAVEDLAAQSYEILKTLYADRGRLRHMRKRARSKAIELFDSRSASAWWDDLYDSAVTASQTHSASSSGPPRLTF